MSEFCNSDDNCFYLYECVDNNCVHKDIWPPNFLQAITYILLPIIIGIANVGGLGGGVVKVPMIMLMLNYPLKIATYMAYCIMFGSVLPNVFLLILQKHPYLNRPLIDFNIALVLNPSVLLGTTMGFYVNVLLPDLVITLMFLIFLFVITPYLFKRGIRLWKEEKQTKKKLIEEQEKIINQNTDEIISNNKEIEIENMNEKLLNNLDNQENDEQEFNLINDNDQMVTDEPEIYEQRRKSTINFEKQMQMNEQLTQLLLNESKTIPLKKLLLMISCFALIQLLNFLRGDKGKSIIGIQKCSATYWVFTSLIVVIVAIFTFLAIYLLKNQEIQKKKLNYPYDKSDIQFTNKNFIKLFMAGCLAGFLSGALGAGAGLATVPILLLLQVHPRVSSATSGFNYIWIALTLIINVILGGYLTFIEIIFFTCLALIGGFGLAYVLYKLVNKYNKTSLVVLFVFGIAFINIVGNIIYIFKQSSEYGWNSLTSFPQFCPK